MISALTRHCPEIVLDTWVVSGGLPKSSSRVCFFGGRGQRLVGVGSLVEANLYSVGGAWCFWRHGVVVCVSRHVVALNLGLLLLRRLLCPTQ